jgi:effector-binding domain-containing protein
MDVKIVQLQEQPTAVVREQVAMNALPEFFGRAFAAVSAAMETQSIQPAGPPFAFYRGMPTEIVDVEAGFPVSTTVAAANGVQAGILPACRAVQAMHVGSYDTLGTMYEAVKQRMKEEDLKASDDMWEYYLSDQSTDPATWRTLVVWPVL